MEPQNKKMEEEEEKEKKEEKKEKKKKSKCCFLKNKYNHNKSFMHTMKTKQISSNDMKKIHT